MRVATNSRSADVTAELIDVGAGTAESDYQGKDVKGKIVLASGNSRAVHALAVWKFGAAGVISYAPQRPYFPDQAAFTSIPYKSDDGKDGTFAFILTQREGDGLHARLAELKRAGKDGAGARQDQDFISMNRGRALPRRGSGAPIPRTTTSC